jgi:hypothetical protein
MLVKPGVCRLVRISALSFDFAGDPVIDRFCFLIAQV